MTPSASPRAAIASRSLGPVIGEISAVVISVASSRRSMTWIGTVCCR
jgi:hypothetical protein